MKELFDKQGEADSIEEALSEETSSEEISSEGASINDDSIEHALFRARARALPPATLDLSAVIARAEARRCAREVAEVTGFSGLSGLIARVRARVQRGGGRAFVSLAYPLVAVAQVLLLARSYAARPGLPVAAREWAAPSAAVVIDESAFSPASGVLVSRDEEVCEPIPASFAPIGDSSSEELAPLVAEETFCPIESAAVCNLVTRDRLEP